MAQSLEKNFSGVVAGWLEQASMTQPYKQIDGKKSLGIWRALSKPHAAVRLQLRVPGALATPG